MINGFQFDFVAPPRHLFWVRWLLLVVGVAGMSVVLGYYQSVLRPQLLSERMVLQQEMAKLGGKGPASSIKPADLAQAWKAASNVSQQLNLPWQRFFAELGEFSKSGDVALMSIEPDPGKGSVVLVAEGRDLNAMLRFVSSLQKSPEFSDVLLQSHTVNRLVPERPIRFRLSVAWRTNQ